jgi:hypothetical protein
MVASRPRSPRTAGNHCGVETRFGVGDGIGVGVSPRRVTQVVLP